MRLRAILRSAIASVLLFGAAVAANASPYVLTLEEVGANVVATGSGAIDLSGLSPPTVEPNGVFIWPAIVDVLTGTATQIDLYNVTASGPPNFGSGSLTFASGGTGDNVGFCFCGGSESSVTNIAVPVGYVSDTALSDNATYDNATFASLGITPGTYAWSWGGGADQSFTIEAGATPLPAALPLFATGLGALGWFGWRRKRPLTQGDPRARGGTSVVILKKLIVGGFACLVTLSAMGASTFHCDAATIKVEGVSLDVSNCIPFGCPGLFGPHTGFVYQNVPAFSLRPGDTIAFDLGGANDVPLSFDISFGTTTSNGSMSVNGSGFTNVVSNGTGSGLGNSILGDFDLRFSATGAFNFAGGGLIIDFLPTGGTLSDIDPAGNLVASDADDPSGFFVGRYYRGAFAGDLTSNDVIAIGGFQIVTGTETPIPAALPLFATGLGALGLLGWRRKRKNAALAA